MVLGDIAARFAVDLDAEAHPARDQRDRPGRDVEPAKLGAESERALLRDDQQFAVGVDEHAAVHERLAR